MIKGCTQLNVKKKLMNLWQETPSIDCEENVSPCFNLFIKVLLRQRHRILVFISCLRPIFLSCKIERTRKFVQTFSLRIKERFMLCPLRTSGYVNRKHSKLKYYTHVYFIQRTFTQRLQKPLVLFLHLFKLINSVI